MNEKSSPRPPMKEIFFVASEISCIEKRQAYLRSAVGNDPQTLQIVERMLQADSQDSDADRVIQALATLDLPADEESMSNIDMKQRPMIDAYRLLHRLGDGGMGEVFIAKQNEPISRTVALKLIKRGMDSDEVLARFDAERQALAMMDHPNIAKVLDAGQTDDGRPYFVMDLVRGIPITDYCQQHKLNTRQRLGLLVEVCHAVQHAHQKGIIHRDLKPSNILVELHDVRHVPKVIDFGVAKAINHQLTKQTFVTHIAQMVGTPLYMSPEQAELSGIDVDTRSDVYALGVLMYELLTGTTPFDKDTLKSAGFDEMRRMIREDDPPKPSHRISTLNDAQLSTLSERQRVPIPVLKRSVEKELDWIVLKALEKDRARRYESASALAADIGRYLDDEAVEACPPSLAYRFQKFSRRYRGLIWTSGLVGVLMIVGLVVTGWQAFKIKQSGEAAQRAGEAAERAGQEAMTNAAIAAAVNEFLTKDLLGQASPFNETDRNVRLRTVLDRAAHTVENRFTDRPLVEAAVRETLGNVFLGLREGLQAKTQFKRCINIRNEYLGTEHPETLAGALGLAQAFNLARRHDEAEKLLRSLITTQQRVLGKEHADTLASQHQLAVSLTHPRGWGDDRDRKREEAEAILAELLKVQTRVLGGNHEDTLSSKNLLAVILNQNDRHAEAERHLRELLETLKRVFPKDHPLIHVASIDLAIAVGSQNRTDEAADIFRDLLQRQRQMGATAERLTLTTMRNLAATVRSTPEAGELLREVLDIRRRELGIEHLDTISSMYELAGWILEQGDVQGCRKLYSEALEINGRVDGDILHNAVNDLGMSVGEHGYFADAEILFREALRQCTRHYGEDSEWKVIPNDLQYFLYEPGDHYMTMIVAANLVYVVLRQERLDEAADIALDALQIGRKVILSETPSKRARGIDHIADKMFFLSWALSSHSDPNKQYPKKALELARAVVKLRPERPDNWMILGAVLYRNGEWSEAVKSFQESGEVLEDYDFVPHMFRAMAHWQLGHRKLAKEIYAQGAAWIDVWNRDNNVQIRLRGEAEALMGLTEMDRKDLIADFYLNSERRHPWFYTGRGIWHQDRGDYESASEDFRKAMDKESFKLGQRRVILLLTKQGKTREAIADLPEIDELENSADFLRSAAVIAYAGERSLYRQLCECMLEKFKTSEEIADVERTCKLCALVPAIIEPRRLPLGQLEKFLQQETDAPLGYWYTLALAAAQYRLKDSANAIKSIDESQTHESYSQDLAAQAFALSLKAMCEHQLAQHAVANQSFDQANRFMEEHWPKVLNDEFGTSWPDWLIAETLRREAADLFSIVIH